MLASPQDQEYQETCPGSHRVKNEGAQARSDTSDSHSFQHRIATPSHNQYLYTTKKSNIFVHGSSETQIVKSEIELLQIF